MANANVPVIQLQGIGKRYLLRQDGRYWFRDLLRRATGHRIEHNHLWALRSIDIDVFKGETVGIIGENGSGKTTLLRLLCNVTPPTEGVMTIRGRVAGLLELGAGFHPYLTGRENLYLNGSILGLTKREMDQKFDQIVEFSGIAPFIDQPVKNYSSGMYVRLGFAIAVHIDPDILVIDEVLAVGDAEFQQRSKSKILEFRDLGKTIVLVSHDLTVIRDVCSRAYWLDRGEIREQGGIEQVTSSYILSFASRLGFLTLSRGPVTLVFEKGKLILFWNGIELTKNSCLSTFLMTQTSWLFSEQAWWEVENSSEWRFTAVGRWKLIPVEQRWTVELSDEDEILWTHELRAVHDVEFTNDTINLRLTDRYQHWWTGTQDGDFPSEFLPSAAQRMLIDAVDDAIGARGFQLGGLSVPGISLQARTPDGLLVFQVLNTESHLRSRDLQVTRAAGMTRYPAGTVLQTQVRIRLHVTGNGAEHLTRRG